MHNFFVLLIFNILGSISGCFLMSLTSEYKHNIFLVVGISTLFYIALMLIIRRYKRMKVKQHYDGFGGN